MRVPLADGAELELAETGEGPPLLLLHGFGGSGRAWGASVLNGLTERARVLAVDLLGHGASTDPPGPDRVGLERVLDDLECALDTAGVDSCAWLGYSMGGRIALAAAMLRPARVERLILESASPGLESETERLARRVQDEALARTIETRGVAAWAEEWERGPLFAGRRALPREVLEPFRAQRLENRPGSLAAWLRGLGTGAQPSFWDRLEALACPTLVLTGADDARYTALARAMAARIRDVRHAVVADAGHTVHLEQPTAWTRAVVAFLAERSR